MNRHVGVLARVLMAVLVNGGVGCSSDDAGTANPELDGGPGGGANGDAAPPSDAGPEPEPPCTGKAGQAGDSVVMVDVAGVQRAARVHVPEGYDPTRRTAVVLNFHGSTSNGWQQELFSVLNVKSDAAGFIAVHPEGLDGSWNAGTCCDPSAKNNVDDVGFVRALIDTLDAQLCVDSRRVYATGMSNGGELAHRLACELPERIAAVASVSGPNLMPTCNSSRPIAVMHMHGTADTDVPYEGDAEHPAVADTIAGWVMRNGCEGEPVQTFKKGDGQCDTHQSCKAGVEVALCTVQDGAHTWPGGLDLPFLGKTSHDLIANDVMWEFFQRHPRP